ncbi:MAG TPA: class I SAM-dependent methyltransferase [Solirubrobacteraceae bacterium]|nr:class I SAM-dependent methyltransferase [Solirubrobacteraceae bacterium]
MSTSTVAAAKPSASTARRRTGPMAAGPSPLERLKARVEGRGAAPAVTFAVTDVDGVTTVLGDGEAVLRIFIATEPGRAAVCSLSELAIADAYINEDIDIEGSLLDAMKLRELLTNWSPTVRVWSQLKPVLVGRRRCNPGWIAKHYDADNVQFIAMDADHRIYTPGLYASDDDTLEDGAERRLAMIYDTLGLAAGETLLDVGCGWGGLMRHCARRGVRPTGISLSRHQVEFARRRFAEEGLTATVLYQDFFSFEPHQRFDAITVMGVLEDISDYRIVMRRLADWIKPGGRVYLDFAAAYRRLGISPFVTRYVWPGKFRMVYMPQLIGAINRSSFDIVELRNDRHNYHLWTRKGYERTTERHREVLAASDERMWRTLRMLYAGCAHIFGPTSTRATAYRMLLQAQSAPPGLLTVSSQPAERPPAEI